MIMIFIALIAMAELLGWVKAFNLPKRQKVVKSIGVLGIDRFVIFTAAVIITPDLISGSFITSYCIINSYIIPTKLIRAVEHKRYDCSIPDELIEDYGAVVYTGIMFVYFLSLYSMYNGHETNGLIAAIYGTILLTSVAIPGYRKQLYNTIKQLY